MISVEHLTKYYGDFQALHDLSFEIEEGHVYGFLGPNGAGKTTTMNIMTGCLSATEGTVKIDGYDIFEDANKAKKRIGYLPEQPPLYMQETPLEYLRFVGEAKGLRGEALRQQIDTVVEQTKIGDVAHRRISTLSKGYRQRVGIAQALLGNPRVIILDEPTVGLDPLQIVEIRDLIRELGRTHTVIFSSHILSEVQTICDRVLIIAGGRLIAFDEPAHLEQTMMAPNEITLLCEAGREETAAILAGVEGLSDLKLEEAEGRTTVHLRSSREDIYEVSRAVFFAFADAGRALLEMRLQKASLEDIFIELTESEAQETGESREVSGMDETAGAQGIPEASETAGAQGLSGPQQKIASPDIAAGHAGAAQDGAYEKASADGAERPAGPMASHKPKMPARTDAPPAPETRGSRRPGARAHADAAATPFGERTDAAGGAFDPDAARFADDRLSAGFEPAFGDEAPAGAQAHAARGSEQAPAPAGAHADEEVRTRC